ncbi:hypothetical protein ACI3ET_16240 [Ornithinimicrobium sp. LYQ121]|uniref:hypothetical protein n=1 Tax=Ornithinimicrobium sp. LYQ121 TaxID=3378801 RepID=UPI003852793D
MQDWFEDRGVRPGDDIPRVRLLQDFLSWLGFHRREGGPLLSRVTDEAARDVLADLLESELNSWTGQVARAGGERRPRGLLVYDEWGAAFSLALNPSADLMGVTIQVADETMVLERTTGLVTVPVERPSDQVLSIGESIRLADGLVLRGGGEPLYLMTESVEAGGLLQERVPTIGMRYSLLVPNAEVTNVREALDASGAQGSAVRSGPVAGWSWLAPVVFSGPVNGRYAGVLGTATPTAPPQSRLHGGLRVAQGAYLTGGAPDVLLQDGVQHTDIRLDGKPYTDSSPQDWVVELPQTRLKTGEHLVATGEERLSFTLQDGFRSFPVASELGHQLDFTAHKTTVFASTAQPLEQGAVAVRGALVQGVDPLPVPLLRVMPGLELLVLTESGRILEVVEGAPQWLVEADLRPVAVEIPAVVRGLDDTPAFVLLRNLRSGRVDAVEVVPGLQTPPGIAPNRERPDLAYQLLTAWRGIPHSAERRRSQALTAAITRYAGQHPPISSGKHTATGAHHLLAVDSAGGNALDDLLRWLSELESGTTSTDRIRETWGWLAPRRGDGDGSDWRLALFHLQNLGHVEVDYGHSRVGTGPPVANVLRRGGGLALLCGARPGALLKTLTTGESADPAVESALAHMVVHNRTQIGPNGQQVGPVAIYLEWDPRHTAEVVSGLAAMSVSTTYASGDSLLNMLPGIDGRLEIGQRFEVPPSKQAMVRERARSDWEPTQSVLPRGLYRFTTRREPVFAWREGPNAPLIQVDRRLGPYLLLQNAAYEGAVSRPLLHRNMSRSTLLVSRDASLTPLLARSLVLRTGFLPRPVEGPHNTFGKRYLEYQNIDQHTAEKVGELLKQPLGYL